MINVTDTIKKAYENSTTQIDKITINNQDYRITNVDYYDDCYLDGNIFGTAIGRMLEFEIENTIELEKAEVKYSTGLLINGTEHWISLGNFIVESIEPNDTTGINKVIAMDYMLKTNVEYESNLDYSSNKITLLQVLQEVCTNSGLELATTSFANSNFIVDSNQFEEGTLNRQVIQAVAQISGTFAKIKSDNKLYLITPKRKGLLVKDVHVITVVELNALPVEKLSACDNEFNLNSYKELVIKRNTHPINLVSLGISDIEGENIVLRDENSISSDGENSLVINDNPFAYTQAKREQLITALFDCVKGFEYTAYEISGQSKPYLETGDEIVAIDKEGNLYNSFLLRFNFKSPKGLESEMSAPSIIKATVEYQNIPDALDVAKKTEIKVDKQNQKIEALVSQQTETGEKLSKVEQTVDSISQKVQNMADLTNAIEGTKKITLENCVAGSLLELHIYGNNNVFKYLYPSDDLYVSDDLIIYGDSRIIVTNNRETKLYELGVTEVLRQNTDVQDEYILANGQAKVIRRVAEDGTTLAKEVIEELGEYSIPLGDGTNVIEILNYTASIEAKFAIQNDYTEVFATKVETEAKFELQSEAINIELSKKIDDDKIIAGINLSTEKAEDGSQLQLKADKISLKGKTLDLGEDMAIVSKKFNVDKDGNMECNNATMTNANIIGGKVTLTSGSVVSPTFMIEGDGLSIDYAKNRMFSDSIQLSDGTHPIVVLAFGGNTDDSVYGLLHLESNGNSLTTDVASHGITTPSLTQTSLESIKKNIEKFENGLDRVKNSEIYTYNLKSEQDTDKKHVGFIIGEKYKTPQEVIAKTGDGIDTYSMISILWKAVQELSNEIKELKGEK